jgi:RNA polymerase sigma factor (sigma-70 family)
VIRTDAPHPSPVAAAPVVRESVFAGALPWVRTIAVSLARRLPAAATVDADDLYQVGSLAAWDLTATWDPAVSRFTSYAKLRVIGVMVDLVRGEAACGFTCSGVRRRLARGESIRVRSLSGQCADSDGWAAAWRHTLGDALGRTDPEFGDAPDAEFAALLRRCGGEVNAQERDAATRYFVGGATMREVGQGMGVSESRVSQLVGRVVAGVRASLESRGRTALTAFA